LVAETAAKIGADVSYIHAPAQNISVARNAALDAVETSWAAFIDDDEVASHDWLFNLLATRVGHNVVIGQVVALYQDGTPRWARLCDFHSNRIASRLENAYTSNALIDVAFARRHGVKFSRESGLTGGEDTLYFRCLKEHGAHFAYCPDAIVYEEVYCERASMNWVYRRKFRSGQTHAIMVAQFEPQRYRWLAIVALLKASISVIAAILLLPFHYSWRKWAARAALHLGALSKRLGGEVYQEYFNRETVRLPDRQSSEVSNSSRNDAQP
jgi:succinoglycan biosynthesis protein ExoM